MAIPEDLAAITRQETELRLHSFDNDTAWSLGLSLHDMAVARNHAIVIDIRRSVCRINPCSTLRSPARLPTTLDGFSANRTLLPASTAALIGLASISSRTR